MLSLAPGRIVALWALLAPPPPSTNAPAGPSTAEVEIPSVEIPAVEVPFERYRLSNGLEVILHSDRTAPEIHVNVWYHVGSGDESPGKSGFAHLFEHMMFQGAKHIGEDVHFDILTSVGATGVNGTTNPDRTNYFETVPANQIEVALWLESDRMGYLLETLTEASFRNQVDVVRNERRQRYDNVPYGRARFVVAEALYPPGHPYRYLTIGRHEDLEHASLEDVRAFFRHWYVPSNATLTLAGDFDPDDIKALVDKWFGSFPRLPAPDHAELLTPQLPEAVRRFEPDPFAKLERVQWVWHGPPALSDDSAALDVATDILDATGWGRLYQRLVLGEQLCTAVFAGYSDQRIGQVTLTAALAPGSDRARVQEILQEELDRMVTTPPADAELRRSVLRLASRFVWSLESLGGRANLLQWFNHYTGDPGGAETYLQRLRDLTPERVREASERWMTAARVELVVVPAHADTEAMEGTP